ARGVAQAGQVQVVDKLGAVSRRCEVDRTRLIQAFRYLLAYTTGTTTGPVVLTVTSEDCRLADKSALQFGIRLDRSAPPAADRDGFFDAFDLERPRKHQLSLAAAYKIIQAHEGRLSLDAGPKMGLVLQLPRSCS